MGAEPADEVRFAAMGSHCHVVATGGQGTGEVRQRIAALEAKWTRFRADSEISQLNRAMGKPTVVSADTYRVVQLAVAAWHETGGIFDPTVAAALAAWGYDRSFELVEDQAASPVARPAHGCAGIELLDTLRAIRLPEHVSLDLGGIGKGAAADVAASEAVAAGVDGVCINIGGDVRVAGRAPNADGWVVGLALPGARTNPIDRVAIADGAVITSTNRYRRWRSGSNHAHHIIDPRTGAPASGVMSVTVVSARAAQAEVIAKVFMVGGIDAGSQLAAETGTAAVAVTDRGEVHTFGGIEEFAA